MHRRWSSRWFVAVPQLVLVGLTLGGAPPVQVRPSPATASGPAPDGAWLARIQRRVQQQEYHASRNARGLQAPNRAHNLRAYFEPEGLRLRDRTAPHEPELAALRLAGLGRRGFERPVPPGEISSEGPRVEIRRPGLVEWYLNGAAGLEQGFTLEERPEGEGRLSLRLALSSGSARGAGLDAAVLRSANGRELGYAGLAVVDAQGRSLPAALHVAGASELRIEADDAGAVYPLTVDPWITALPDALLQSDQAGASLGFDVARAGDVNADGYGDVIVGASAYDLGEANEGAAFVFLGGPTGIANGNPATASATLQADQAGAVLGIGVAGAGDVNGDGYEDVLVGAQQYDAGEADEGAAFVFLGGPGGIQSGNPATASAMLQADQASASFGTGVAGAGDVNGDGYADVLVGASNYDAGEANEGAAFVFLGGPAGIQSGNPATASATLQADQPGAILGGVAGAGDVNGDGYADVLVGASNYDAGEANEGAAFVFLGGPAGIQNGNPASASATLQANQVNALFGASVAGAGDLNGDGYADVIVGAFVYDAGELDEGAAFVFLGGPAGVADGDPATAAAQLEPNQADAGMGFSVAGAGDVNGDGYSDLLVGAFRYDAGEANEGAAFVFLGGSAGIADGTPATANATLQANQASAALGSSVASAGDVNGDGYADVVVGADTYDSGEADEGAAFVFLGGPAGIANGNLATASAVLQADQAGANLGASVASAGDVNGDGYGDLIVGARNYDAGEADEGAAFVFLGGPAGIASGNPASASARLESNQVGALLGSVASAGDVNGDGHADVIVGAFFYDAGQSNEGAAFVFLGGPSGVPSGNPATASARLECDQVSCQMGFSVAGAGDLNGDGYADVIVGAHGFDAGEGNEGAAFVFLGGPAGIASGDPTSASATLQANQASASLGGSVAGAGDVNRDGYADVVVGALNYDSGESNEGAAFVFLGGPAGIASGDPTSASATLQANQASASLGGSVAGAGDVNGDGYADVVVSAANYDSGETNEGAAFVFLGGPTGVQSGDPSTAGAVLQADQANAFFGESVAGAGDVNGDGYADVIVGASLYDAGQADEGAALVFLGNGRPGRPVLARQLRGNGSTTPAQAWGLSHDGEEFQVRLAATNPEGRRHLAIEVEACPDGANWGSPACVSQRSPWVEAPSGVAVLTETVTGLGSDREYRWRARALYGRSASSPGVTLPLHPAHGPWRRMDAQSREADIRTSAVANLGVVLSDLPDPVVAGQALTYALSVANGGPSTAHGVTATQALPLGSTFLGASGSGWTCTELLGTLTCTRASLPVGSSTVLVQVTAPASGPLDSSVLVASAAIDTNPFDDFGAQATFVTPLANLAITKTDGVTSVVPGSTVTYTLGVSNAGPAAANGAIVNDTLAPILAGASWTCTPSGGASCPPSGSGSISHAVDLPAGAALSYSLAATVNASAAGVLVNTATVTPPATVADANPLDNQASDVDQLVPTVALALTKTNGLATVLPGQALSYTLVASNAGPNDAFGASVIDTLPAALTSASWSCVASAGSVCPASGAGSINHAVNLLSGGTLTYTLNATVSASATGVVSNSASIGAPAGFADPDLANNSAQDADPVDVNSDLAVTNSDGLGTAVPGTSVTYAITVTNAGPRAAVAANVFDALPAGLQDGSWSCSASAGSSCTPSGSGGLNDTVTLLPGGTLSYTLTGTIRPDALGTLTNSVAATVPPGLSDPNAANNSASDTDTLTPSTDLALTLSDSPDPAPVFGTIVYTLDTSNAGPSAASGGTATLTLPAGLSLATASPGCTNAAGTVSCSVGALGPSQSRSFSISATADPGTRGTLVANAVVAGAEADPAGANNGASASTSVRFYKGDLENDLDTDIVLRRFSTGENAVWLMNGATRASNVLVTPDPPSLDWSVVGVDDFDADNRNDLVFWSSATGAVEFWKLGGPTGSDRQGAPLPLADALPLPWRPSATADFDHDGRPDLVYRNFSTQKIAIWTMNGTTHAGTIIPSPDQAQAANWEIVGAQDWNGDQNTDFLWYNPDSGKIVLWFMDGNVVRITGQFTNPPNAGANNWKVLAMGDYGVGPGGLAGTIDILWRNASSGKFVLWYMDQAGNRTAGVFTSPDGPSDPLGWTIVGPR